MDPVTIQLKTYDKSLRGMLEILEKASWKIAHHLPRDHILEAIKGDLKNLIKCVEIYEKEMAS